MSWVWNTCIKVSPMGARAPLRMQNRSMRYRVSERSVLKGVFPFGGLESLTFPYFIPLKFKVFKISLLDCSFLI